MFSLFGIPSIISSALTFSTPILGSILKVLSWYVAELWDGIKINLQNPSTLIVLSTVSLSTLLYGTTLAECGPVYPDAPSTLEQPWGYDFGIR